MMIVEQEKPVKRTIDFIYNPDNQSKAELIDGFVVRQKMFERHFADIKEAPMQAPEQHVLIEGKRGMGKTTFLLRLAYQIENDADLKTWLLPVVFNEEEYSIRKLYKLWERIAVLLEDKDDSFLGLNDEMNNSFNNYESDTDYEIGIYDLLNQKLEAAGKKLVLFIDNFGDIFLKFNKQEVQRLRTVLQTNTNIRIFAASSTVLEVFYDYKHPFYEFFKVSRLKGLNAKETQDLLLKLGEAYKQDKIKNIIENESGRVEALRRLTGGVIRTIVLLFEIFIDQNNGSAFKDLEALLDRVTPLYKHRMDDLPAQQQEIMEALAFEWDAINVSEISKKTRIASKTVSAQLRQMEKNEIITKKLSNNKNHFYQISERFFNIWYLMRHGRKGDKNKVVWLVRFLEEWCSEDELIGRAEKHIELLKGGNYDEKAAYFMTEALAGVKDLPDDIQDNLLCTAREFLNDKNSEWAKELSESDLELLNKVRCHFKEEDFNSALACLSKIKKRDEYHTNLKKCLIDIKHLLIKIKKEDNTQAMIEVAIIFSRKFNDVQKAVKYFTMAAEKGDDEAMYNLGILYYEKFKDLPKAIKLFKDAIENGHIDALNNLGVLYIMEMKDFSKAEKYFLMAAEKGYLDAMYNVASLYEDELKDFPKAEKYFLMAAEKGHLRAMNRLGCFYHNQLKDSLKAEKYFLKAFQKERNLAHKKERNLAANNLALLYHFGLKDFSKAEKYYMIAIEQGHTKVMERLAFLYFWDLNDFQKAEKYFQLAIDNGQKDAMHGLACLYFIQIINNTKALSYSKQIFEIDPSPIHLSTYALLLLWNNKINKSHLISNLIKDPDLATETYLILNLAKNQYQFLYSYFTSPKAKELKIKQKFKPIWYALMYYMQDEHPNEYLRMGSELEETVKEIIEQVEQMRIDYA